ncbi:MAG: hypothetical protein A2170_15355 [Deltaproteobacteria bacterium RBG_13_53_10]|nr:MAG: hypothetical protein A2170_15355 [Deltaproteobacteria bacterium RBG_13_53_10]
MGKKVLQPFGLDRGMGCDKDPHSFSPPFVKALQKDRKGRGLGMTPSRRNGRFHPRSKIFVRLHSNGEYLLTFGRSNRPFLQENGLKPLEGKGKVFEAKVS